MNEILNLQQKIVPEIVELLLKRYRILKSIYYNQPVGRRALSQVLNLGERVVRTEVNFLKEQSLIEIHSTGMMVTKEGENILESLEEMIHEISGLAEVEEKLKNYLGVHKVIVVPGDTEEDITVLKEMGRLAGNYIKTIITNNSIIALTGGSSVAQVVENFPKVTKENLLVIPARGGIGTNVETQASTLAAKLAHKLNANYKLLNVPDNLSLEAQEAMLNEPNIKDVVQNISKADILIFGIGRADRMSKKRGLKDEEINLLLSKGAVAEAFGYYFNKLGDIVYTTPTMGLKFENVKNIKNVIAVAGGKAKANAIIATKTYNPSTVIVTDEAAAKEILRIKDSKSYL